MKILVIELAYIGDTLMTTPFLRALKEHRPYADLHFLVSSRSAEVLRTNPYLKGILEFDRGGGAGGFWRTVLRLRKERFDVALMLHRSFRSALLAFLAGIPVRVGYSTEGRSFLLTHATPYDPALHRARNHMKLFQYYRQNPARREFGTIGGTWDHAADPDNAMPLPAELDFPVPDDVIAAVREKWLAGVGDYFVLNPGGSWPTKQWPAERFAQVARRLSTERGWTPVVIGASHDPTLDLGDRAIDLRGKTNLLELAAVVKGAKVFVTNDSGPLHIGVAVGVPTVSLFGPTDARRTGPFSPDAAPAESPHAPLPRLRHVAIQAQVWCSPCYLKKCPAARGFVCMKSITPLRVLDQVGRVAGAQ